MLSPLSVVPPETILVVDDESTLRELLERVLTLAGFKVLAAEHGEHALRQARRHAGELNLVLTDVNMPVMGGLEFIRLFRPLYPRTPILFMTGRGSQDFSLMAEVESCGSLLKKPFGPDLLLDAVTRTLSGRPHVGRSSA
jgi:CheY-like chemotaxis protein